MKPRSIQKFGIVLALTAFLVLPSFANAQTATFLSDELPREFVRQLMADQLWDKAFDDPKSAAQKDLRAFWQEIQSLPNPKAAGDATQTTNAGKLAEVVVDRLFGFLTRTTQPDGGVEVSAPPENLYPIKFRLLRFLLAPADSNGQKLTLTGFDGQLIQQLHPQLVDLHRRWMARYLEMALALINIAGIPEYAPITANFRRQLVRGDIQIRDLSPLERVRLRDQIAAAHGVGIDARVKRDSPNFRVVGLYNEEEHYLALDFARPTEDTLRTFAHEIVHAADERLTKLRETYKRLYPVVKDIMIRWAQITDPADIDRWTKLDFLGLVETSMDRAVTADRLKFTQEQRQALITKVNQDIVDQMKELQERATARGASGSLPTVAQMKTVREWLQTLIGLTTENEFRAHGLSIQLQSILTQKAQLLFPSQELQEYVELFSAGDSAFGFHISEQVNVMPRFRPQLLSHLGNRKDDSALGTRLAVNILQTLYYDETNLFLDRVDRDGGRFSKALAALEPKAIDLEDAELGGGGSVIVPEWAEEGKYGLPSNPHQLVGAIPTTTWVLGYRQRIQAMEKDLRRLTEPVLNWRIGILDLSDLSLEDTKRVGIFDAKHSESLLPQGVDREVLACLRRNRDSLVSADILDKYLKIASFADSPRKEDQKISGRDLMSNLIGHRLIRAHVMLQKLRPVLVKDLVTLRMLDEKIQMGMELRDSEFFSERHQERKEQLLGEIDFVHNRLGTRIKNDILRVGVLIESVGNAFEVFARERKWTSLANAFFRQNQRILSDLEIVGGKDHRQATLDVVRASNQLRKQLLPEAKFCEGRDPNDSYYLFGVGKKAKTVTLDLSQEATDNPASQDPTIQPSIFPLLLACYGGKLFAVRQPCDFVDFMTRMAGDRDVPGQGTTDADLKQLEGRIFYQSRKVVLLPVDTRIEKEDDGQEKSLKKSVPGKPRKILGIFSRGTGSKK